MQSLLRSLLLSKAVALFILVLFSRCDKDPALSGDDIGKDLLQRIDSLETKGISLLEGTLNTANRDDVLLGISEDSRFGKTKACFYTELMLSKNSFTPGNNAVVDSASLQLAIRKVSGNMTQSLDVYVYRLNEELNISNTYLSNTTLDVILPAIGTKTIQYTTGKNTINIPIDLSVANDMFFQFGTSVMDGTDNFQDFFKGLYVTVADASGGDGFLNFNLLSDSSCLNLYFHSDNSADSVYTFTIESEANRLNRYIYDFAGSELEMNLQSNTSNHENLYVGGPAVSYALVNLPDLSFLADKVINQATLSFYQSDYGSSEASVFNAPNFLLLSGATDTDSSSTFLPDYSSSSPSAYGGLVYLTEVEGQTTNAYTYNIPIFMQQYASGKTLLNKLKLEVVDIHDGERVKLGGGNHQNFPIRLELLYTK